MRICFLNIVLALLIPLTLSAAENEGGNSGAKQEGARFLPYNELSFSGKYFTHYKNSYYSAWDIFFLSEFFRRGDFDLSFDFTGTTAFRESSGGIEPDLIFYRINYLNARWKTPAGYFGIFADHLCNNRVNINGRDRDRIRWYGAGFRWEAPGFSGSDRIRHAGRKPFLTGSLSGAYGWSTDLYPYTYSLSGTVRIAGPDLFFIFPYLEGALSVKLGDEKKVDGRSEGGITAGWDDGEFTLFTGTERVNGTNGYYEREKLNHFTGIRFTSWISDEGEEGVASRQDDEKLHFPKLYLNGVYGKYINNRVLNYHTDIHMLLYLPAAENSGLYGSLRLRHDSLKEDNGMYPRYIQYSYEGGLNILLRSLGMTLIPYTHFQRYEEGNTYDGYSNWFASAGVRAVTALCHGDSRMRQNRSLGDGGWFPVLWVSGERVYGKGGFPVNGIVRFNINQQLFRGDNFGILLSGEYKKYLGDFNSSVYSVEPSLLLGRKGFVAIYYRYTHRKKEMAENGIFRIDHLAGVRFTI